MRIIIFNKLNSPRTLCFTRGIIASVKYLKGIQIKLFKKAIILFNLDDASVRERAQDINCMLFLKI